MRKPRFRRGVRYVAVRPLRMGDTVLEPGALVSEEFPTVRLRRWFRRNRIGPVDSPWTEAMLAMYEGGDAQSTRTSIDRRFHGGARSQAKQDQVEQTQRTQYTGQNKALSDLLLSQAAKNGTMDHLGGGYFRVYHDNRVTRVRGKKDAEALLGA